MQPADPGCISYKANGEKKIIRYLDNFYTDWIFDDINLFRYTNVIKNNFIKSPSVLQIH